MPTVECKDCRQMVSTSADVCPHCGARNPASYVPSTLVVHRDSGVLGFAVAMRVFVDGKKEGQLGLGETFTVSIPAGRRAIEVKGPHWGTLSGRLMLEIEPASVYRIELSVSVGFPELSVNFQVFKSDT